VYMYAYTAYVRELGYIGEIWRDIIDQGDMVLHSSMYGMSIAHIRILRYVKPANIRPSTGLLVSHAHSEAIIHRPPI
jgi:hypothetical protein